MKALWWLLVAVGLGVGSLYAAESDYITAYNQTPVNLLVTFYHDPPGGGPNGESYVFLDYSEIYPGQSYSVNRSDMTSASGIGWISGQNYSDTFQDVFWTPIPLTGTNDPGPIASVLPTGKYHWSTQADDAVGGSDSNMLFRILTNSNPFADGNVTLTQQTGGLGISYDGTNSIGAGLLSRVTQAYTNAAYASNALYTNASAAVSEWQGTTNGTGGGAHSHSLWQVHARSGVFDASPLNVDPTGTAVYGTVSRLSHWVFTWSLGVTSTVLILWRFFQLLSLAIITPGSFPGKYGVGSLATYVGIIAVFVAGYLALMPLLESWIAGQNLPTVGDWIFDLMVGDADYGGALGVSLAIARDFFPLGLAITLGLYVATLYYVVIPTSMMGFAVVLRFLT